jgi:hypothetical protein
LQKNSSNINAEMHNDSKLNENNNNSVETLLQPLISMKGSDSGNKNITLKIITKNNYFL